MKVTRSVKRGGHRIIRRALQVAIALATLVGVLSIVSPEVASATSFPLSVTVTPSVSWVDTGLAVSAGTFYDVSASGTILGMSGAPGTPAGTPWASCGSATVTSLYPGLDCGALIARIGAGIPFTIGTHMIFDGAPGELYLGVNEQSLSGLSGSWSATITTGSLPNPVLGSQRFGGGGGVAPGTCTTCTGGGVVDPATGDVVVNASDASVPTVGPSLDVSRTYDSTMAQSEVASLTPGPLGYGWTDSYATSLLLNSDYGTSASGDVTLVQPNGSEALFVSPVSGTCPSPYVGSGASGTYCTLASTLGTLSYNSTTSTYTLLEYPSSTYTFNASGLLSSMSDVNGATETVAYDTPMPGSGNCPVSAASCETITAATGTQTMTLGWSARGDSGVITSVTDPAGYRTTYGYSSGNLTSVTDNWGHVTTYSYDTANPNATYQHDLITQTSPNEQPGQPDAGTSTSINYDSSGRATQLTVPTGQTSTFNYSSINPASLTGSVTETGASGDVTQYNYTSGVLVFSTTSPSSTPETTYYATNGLDLLTIGTVDPTGAETASNYDAHGNIVASIPNANAAGDGTGYTYNTAGEVTCSAQPLAALTCNSQTLPSPTSAGGVITLPAIVPPAYLTFHDYDTFGREMYQTTGDYAPNGTLLHVRTSYTLYNGNTVTLGSTLYSCSTPSPAAELPCATINPDGVITQLGYDAQGDLTSSSVLDANTVSTPGVISTLSGGPMGVEIAKNLSQNDSQIATVTLGGVAYAYVADSYNNVIRRINLATDQETVVAGNYAWGPYGDGGPATSAQLGTPSGVAVDSAGDITIADSGNDEVRFVPAVSGTYFGQTMTGGDIYRIAGTGSSGFSGDNGPATSARLHDPQSVAFYSGGVLVTDTLNSEVRFIPATSGTYFGQSMTGANIYAVVGNATAGYVGTGVSPTSAEVSFPQSVAVDSSGDVAIGDSGNNVVRFIPASTGTYYGVAMTAGKIYTVAGAAPVAGSPASSGYSANGTLGTSALLNAPSGVAFDASGNLYYADSNNFSVRVLARTSGSILGHSVSVGTVYTVAGSYTWGDLGNGAPATSASMGYTGGVAIDPNGDLVLDDTFSDVVRIVANTSGPLVGNSSVTPYDIYAAAGTGAFSEGLQNGPAANAEFNSPSSVRVDSSGDVVVADTGNNVVRFIPAVSGTYFGQAMTAGDIYDIAGNGWPGFGGDGGPATSAILSSPGGASFDAAGDVVIADTRNNVVRFVPRTSGTYFGQSMTSGDIYTIAGTSVAGYSSGVSSATTSPLNGPMGATIDATGNLLIADTSNNVIRFVPKVGGTYFGQAMTGGDLYTVAGSYSAGAGFSGNGAVAMSAQLNKPSSVTVDATGDLIISDVNNSMVRFVPNVGGTYFGQVMSANAIYTIAGSTTRGYAGDRSPAISAQLSWVSDAMEDPSGNLFIVDSGNDVIRFEPATTGLYFGQSMLANNIYTIAGAGWTSNHFAGDGGSPLQAQFAWIISVASDLRGGYYIDDSVDQRVRHVSALNSTSFAATTTYTYNGDGQKTSMTLPNGNAPGANAGNFTTTYTYGANGELTSETQGGGPGATVTPRTTSYTYDANGNRLSMTDPRGYTTTYAFNADNQQVLVTDPMGNSTLTCYDGSGNLIETVPAVGVAANSLTVASCASAPARLASDATTFAYNTAGQKISMTTPAPAGLSGTETTTYAYDGNGNLVTVSAPATSNTVGAPNNVTEYTYNNLNQLTSTTTGYGTTSASTTSTCYDPNGDVTATVPGDGNVSGVTACATTSPYQTASPFQTGYAFDSLGEMVSQSAPATTAAPSGQVTTYTYDPSGNQLTSTNPDGVTTTKTYTPLGQVQTVSYSNRTNPVGYSYDANGNMTTMTDASGITTNVYDPFNELTSTTNGSGQTVSYGYGLDGLNTAISYPLGSAGSWASTYTVNMGYNHDDQLQSVTDFNGHTSTLTYTADGLLSSLSLGASGDTVNTTYAASDNVAAVSLTSGSSTLASFTYTDSPSGAVASESDTPSTSFPSASYVYSAQGRVTAYTPTPGSSSNYTQDASGNLTTLPTGASATYDNGSELTSSTLAGTTTNYTYDAAGNRLGSSISGTASTTALFNGANQLTYYHDTNAGVPQYMTMSYNGQGLRTASSTTTSSGTTYQSYVWNTISSVPQLLMDATNAFLYAGSYSPFAQVNLASGSITYLLHDQLGSVRATVNSTGVVTGTVSYDAWGQPTSTSLSSPFGFAGSYEDVTGLDYLIGRFYNYSLGQFLNVDPAIISTGQAYIYCGSDPVDNVDPLGRYFYNYYWDIGRESALGSPLAVFTFFKYHPQEIFPFPISCSALTIGSKCLLVPEAFNRDWLTVTSQNDVYGMWSLTFTVNSWTALGNVIDPAGSTITFSIGAVPEALLSGGPISWAPSRTDIVLEQRAQAGSTLFNWVGPLLAVLAWNHQASNLSRLLGGWTPELITGPGWSTNV
ncbi:MAG: hypothetical protein KGR42_02355 [Acidobacteria bacterium]|nr:hypothetical protein [Acidobacteriota bacterium]